MKFNTVALIVPNNHSLKGPLNIDHEIKEISNSLKYIGYELKKILAVQENNRAMASEIAFCSKLYDIVLILTTSDLDFVSQALANISQQELSQQIELKSCKCVLDKTNTFNWPKVIKLLKFNSNLNPVIYFQRIFILTVGLVKEQLNYILKDHLIHYKKENLYTKMLYVSLNGHKNLISLIQNENITVTLDKLSDEGSEKDVIKLISENFENVTNMEILIKEKIGLSILNSKWINTVCDMVYGSTDKHIKFAIEVIEKCLEEYGLENVFLSFNGGKDCTVLLHLILTVIEKKYPTLRNSTKLFCLYVKSENAFKEQDDFIEQCRIFFNLEVVTIKSNIKDALRIILQSNPNFKACFMGTRRTDPFSETLNTLEMTDPEWPQVMRCSPLLDWYYSDIWDYLLYYKVSYCKLYDYGYTSLGNATNTIRNPSLLFTDGDKEIYLPAYKLLDEKKERIGRNISKI